MESTVFVLKHTGLTPEVIQGEIHYAMNRIRLVKNNESSWNFLRGLLEQENFTTSDFPDVEAFTEELYNAGNRSPHLLSFLVDMYIEKTMHVYKTNSYDDPEAYSRKVYELCDMLANHYDTIRYKYWKYIQQKFKDDKERAKQPIGSTSSEEEKLNLNGDAWVANNTRQSPIKSRVLEANEDVRFESRRSMFEIKLSESKKNQNLII